MNTEETAATAWLFEALGTRSSNPLTLEMVRVRAHLQEDLEKCEKELLAMEKEWKQRPTPELEASPRDAKRFLGDGWRTGTLSLTSVTSPSFCLRPQLASTLRERVAQDVLPPYLVIARANAVLAAEQGAPVDIKNQAEQAAEQPVEPAQEPDPEPDPPELDLPVEPADDLPLRRRRRSTTAGVQTRSSAARLRIVEDETDEEATSRKRRPKAAKKEAPKTRKTRRTRKEEDELSPTPTKRTTRSSTRSVLLN